MCNCNDVKMGSYDAAIAVPCPRHMENYRQKRLDAGLDADWICIDACILKEISELWQKGIITHGSCCGHNLVEPMVNVADESIPAMIALGYEMNHPDKQRRDTFRLKSVQSKNISPEQEAQDS